MEWHLGDKMIGISNISYFLIGMFFSLITFILWLRLAVRFFKISPFNQVAQITYRLTNPIIQPLVKLFNLQKLNAGRYDLICLFILLVVLLFKYLVIDYMFFNGTIPILALPLLMLADLIIQPCDLLFYAIMIQVIISWVNQGWRNPISEVLFTVTAPLLNRCRRILPDTAGLDFSPLLAIVILKIITIFINSYLPIHM